MLKTFISSLIPKLQQYSKKLDDQSVLANKHWLVLDEDMSVKQVFIFRTNGDLLISVNGKIEKARWEYLGANSLMIERSNESLLFKHGFLDDQILALQLDSENAYAILINEDHFKQSIPSLKEVFSLLESAYIKSDHSAGRQGSVKPSKVYLTKVKTKKGILEIESNVNGGFGIGDKAKLNGKIAEDGKYITGWPGWLDFIVIKDGRIIKI